MSSLLRRSGTLDADPTAAPWTRAAQVIGMLAVLAASSLMLAAAIGTSHLSLAQVIRVLFSPDDSSAAIVVHQLRLPRALCGFAAGGLLALAGALMQVLLRNPLADPYVLGVSSGSAVGALGAMLVGAGAAWVTAGAFAGALVSVALVFGAAFRELSSRAMRVDSGTPTLLLTGVIMASGWTAIVTGILVAAPEQKLKGMLFWLIGDLSAASAFTPALVALALMLLAVLPLSRDLNVILRGSKAAQAMGVEVARVRRTVLAIASLATAISVTTAGAIGFVGLVVPHALRLIIGNDQRVLLPACALAGGTLVVVADVIARTAMSPIQLPVGIVMSAIGVPTFLALLLGKRNAA